MTEHVPDRDEDDVGSDSPEGATAILTCSVPEMDCPSCAGKVDASLGRVDGLVEIDTQPTTGTVTVTYRPDRTSEGDVVDAIEGAGYEVTNRSADDSSREHEIAPPSAVWTSRRGVKTWIGAVFLTVGLALAFVVTDWNQTLAFVPLLEPTVTVPEPLVPLLEPTLADVAFLLAVLASGVPVVRSGYYSARNRSLDIDLLMGTAIVVATAIGLFVEAATLAVLFSIAELLEQYAMDRTRNSLRELLELAPSEATVLRDGEEVTVPAEDVTVGETVVVRPGEQIPVDGVVRDGSSAVDQSPITGESVPVDRAEGDEVFAGTLTETGYLEIEATATADETTLSQIIDLVREAQAATTEREQFVDRFASYYTPVVVGLAILTALLPPLLLDGHTTITVAGLSHTVESGWETWIVRGLTLLVIACPCAFVISTPVSVASGVTAAARNGVLVKGGNHLEAMGDVDAIALDKTGTLTRGELAVTDVVPVGDATETDVLRYAAALEQRSEHPIAEAILDRAADADVSVPEVADFESLTGKGVQARVDGTTYYAGKPGLFEELGFDLDGGRAVPDGGEPSEARRSTSELRSDGGEPSEARRSTSEPRSDGGVADTIPDEEFTPPVDAIGALEGEGKTVVLVGTADRLVGVVGVADELRPSARRAVENLHRLGVAPIVMLTGDNEGTARAVADELGLDEYRAELLPDEKVAAVDALEDEYGTVAMVGDGVNDAPALATATVGVAMGAAGTDTAIETADIALMEDDVGKLPYLYALSTRANTVIRQNIWSSLGVKALLAVGVPFGYVTVAMAVVIGDMGMSLGVTGNAMRLARLRPERFLES